MKKIVFLILITALLSSCLTQRKEISVIEICSAPYTSDCSIYGTIKGESGNVDTVYVKTTSYRKVYKAKTQKRIKVNKKQLRKAQ